MGIKLMVEVMDHWQDAGLTAGERSDLLVIAENANEQSRETVGPMHEQYLLQRAGKTSAAAWRNSLGKLMKKGALEYAVHDSREMSGFPGRWAVYRLPGLCPDAPHDGLHGQCTRGERVTPQVTQSGLDADIESRSGNPSGDPIGEMGHLSDVNGSPDRCERVTSQVTPNPPTPQPPPSLPGAPVQAQQQPGREGGGIASLEEQAAYRTLARIAAKDPRLTVGETELHQLAPLAVTWLQRTTEQQLEQAITAGLPGTVGNPAGLLRTRLLKKLPPPPQPDQAEERCGRDSCNPVTHMLTLPDHSIDFCPVCHPTGRARARRQQRTAA